MDSRRNGPQQSTRHGDDEVHPTPRLYMPGDSIGLTVWL